MSGSWWLALLLFAIVTGGLGMLVRHVRRSVNGPLGCGHCGYPVIGQPTSVCSECGTDRTAVAPKHTTWWVRQSAQRRRAIRVGLLTVWVAAAAALAWDPYDKWVQPRRVTINDYVDLCGRGKPLYGAQVARRWADIWCWPSGIDTPGDRSEALTMWCVLVRPIADRGCPGLYPLTFVEAGTVPARRGIYAFAFDPVRAVISYDSLATGTLTEEAGSDWTPAFRRWAEDVAQQLATPELPKELGVAVSSVLRSAPGDAHASACANLDEGTSGSLSGNRRDWRFVGAAGGIVVLVWLVGTFLAWGRGGDRRRAGSQ